MVRIPLVGALLAVSSIGCASTPAATIVPQPTYHRAGQAKAVTSATSSRPLVIEWPAAERVRLEASSKRGLVVVRYDDTTMEVLARCSAEGAYAYTPTTPQREAVRIRDEDELRANLPLGAASLTSQLARSGVLTVELSVVGTYETPARPPTRGDLVGECDGATHVVVGLTAGAFQFFSGGSAGASASGDALGAGAGGRSASRRELLSEVGDMASCKTAASTDSAPPFGCGALLRVEVVRLASPKAPASDPAAAPLDLTPIAIHVTALLADQVVVERTAELVFQNDEAKLLRLPLCAACKGVTCEAGETCVRGTCSDASVNIDSLPGDGEGVELAGECAAE